MRICNTYFEVSCILESGNFWEIKKKLIRYCVIVYRKKKKKKNSKWYKKKKKTKKKKTFECYLFFISWNYNCLILQCLELQVSIFHYFYSSMFGITSVCFSAFYSPVFGIKRVYISAFLFSSVWNYKCVYISIFIPQCLKSQVSSV